MAGNGTEWPFVIAGGGLAAGVTAELRDRMLGARTPEQAYDGMAWLYGEAA